MKVYIAEGHYDYEGFNIMGVFSTKDAAQACIDKSKNSLKRWERCDNYKISEHAVKD